MSQVLYRIREWNKHFENNRTRELKKLDWIPVPNRHDGDGYTELMSQGDAGMSHLGAFLGVVQVASKCDPRGTLLRDGSRPHDCASLARILLSKSTIIQDALDATCSVGWVEWQVDGGEWFTFSPAPKCDSSTAPCCAPSVATGCLEGKGMEGKGKEEKRGRPKAPPFVKPTVEEVAEEIKAKNFHFQANVFVDFYEAKGWKIGKDGMKDWRASCRTWEHRWLEEHPESNYNPNNPGSFGMLPQVPL